MYSTILVTGGAGFVGSNLALWARQRYPNARILAADNLRRRGSELHLPRLRAGGVEFVHCDIRNPEDLRLGGAPIDLVLECSAEPSILAAYDDAPNYVINTNLLGTVNCLELARQRRSDFLFISTSRVYPVQALNCIRTREEETRFVIDAVQDMPGISPAGVSEAFPLEGARSLYGATKLASELLINEYAAMYGLRTLINRCGVLTGPWQMGKVDQGVFALWMGRHYFKRELSYIGWGGTGKQVRDLLDIADLADLVGVELDFFDKLAGQTFNVGGGLVSSLSLLETTLLCREISGHSVAVHSIPDNRPADVKVYITDNTRVTQATGWSPRRTPRETLTSLYEWIRAHEASLEQLWV